VMGEYMGRLYMEAKGRPLFIIQEVYTSPATASSSQHVETAANE
ncbi:glycosyltransferase, partial [Pseudomonas syringae]